MSFEPKYKFVLRSESTGRVIVGPPDSHFGLTFRPGTATADPEYLLGYKEAPLFEIVQPNSPDDRWHIHPRVGGRMVQRGPSYVDPNGKLREWAAIHSIPDLVPLCEELPQGEYLAVVARGKPRHADRVLVGNEWVPAGVNTNEVLASAEYYSAVFANYLDRAPDISAPVIGVVVLNYAGQRGLDAVLFFPVIEPRAVPEKTPLGIAAVVPLRGPLVIDALAGFCSKDREIEARETWASRAGMAFVDLLASGISGVTPR